MTSDPDLKWVAQDVSFQDAVPWTVLVADDATLWRRIVRKAVRNFGAQIRLLEAETGQAALDLLSKESVDLAFVDLAMPEMNGVDVIERLRDARKMPFFAVISVTSDAEQIARLRRLAAYDYLVKPFDAAEVQRVLSTYERISQRTSVLVVDDSGTTLSIIRRLLSHSIFSLDIHDAKDGVTAFEAYAKKAADIVFLDLNMPGLDGAQTLRILRAYNPNVCIVFMSARQESLDAARSLGATAYLKKPFAPRDLDAIMHRIYGLRLPYRATGV